jgi:aspartate/methionine/tyrosine aminotransferase
MKLSILLFTLGWAPSVYSWLVSQPSVVRRTSTKLHANDASAINPLLALIKPSKTVEIFSLVKQMQAEGQDVTSLCVGEPDYLPPPQVLTAVADAVTNGQTRYTAVTGTLELRQAIADDLKRRKHVEYNPLTEIIVGNGAKQSVFQGIMACAGVGDEVLVPAPHWPYPEMVKLTGAIPSIVNTSPKTGYLLTPADLRRALEQHPKAKLLILCNPSNPTGGVYGQTQLTALVEVLNDYPDVKIMADEIYERLVYEGDCPSFAAQPGMFERTITINGFSKSHAMTGMRLGYLAAPEYLAKAASKIQSQLTSCAGSLSQAGGVAAIRQVPEEWFEKNVQDMRVKRDYVLKRLAAMPGVKVEVPPSGAFYVLPDISAYGDDAELCLDLLKTKKLALVPGESFGAPGTVRLSYATSLEELETAMDKLESYLLEKGVL